ncbi:siderophore ABC transporter substrate-binding protein [Neobacillus mesonae]|uniref:siderophore ABC transporter substrate-binding protein n=1 Tax=Neobacillus mesonae TaxID=1193713 RepID=UPI0020414C45|nr:siderophore ABC transporter substrate-binding protein [Neobacillus mesonae]MCM3568593.1 siderophore ABC transporter substrate-binding protein [Neobacillus mesonae]
MKKWSLLSVVFSIILVLAACGGKNESTADQSSGSSESADKITVEHKYGKAVVKTNPQKVVVFDFGILDTLDELGVEVTGVPQTTVPKYLEKYKDKKYTNVGSLKEPDFEAIHSMKPDVIFISARQAELYDQFAEIAPTVFIDFDYTHYMDSFEKNMNLVGKVFGKEDQVAAKMKDIEGIIEAVHKEISTANKKALIVMANEGKVSAYGPSSRFGLIHDVFGFGAADKNIEVSTHGQSITFEYIMEKNPDYLFVIDRNVAIGGESNAKQTIENDLVKKTNAYKNGKIIYLNADTWYLSGGGLKSVKIMADEVESAL